MRSTAAGVMVLLPAAALANTPPQGDGAVTTGYAFSNVEVWGAAAILLFCVFITGAAYFLRRSAGFTEDAVIRLVSLILIVSGTLFLVTLGYTAEQIAPALGILGTIAGYMLGRTDRKDDRKSDTETRP